MGSTVLSAGAFLLLLFFGGSAQGSPALSPELPALLGTDSRFKSMDEVIARVRAMTSQFEEFINTSLLTLKAAQPSSSEDLATQAEKRLQQKCLSDFSIGLIAGEKAPLPVDSLMVDLQRYHACEAFTQRKPDLCKELVTRYRPKEPHPHIEINCLGDYNRYVIIQLNITGRPDAAKVCGTLPLLGFALEGQTLQEECAFQTAPVDSRCKNLTFSRTAGGAEREECIQQGILNGDESACSLISAPSGDKGDKEGDYQYTKRICQDAVAYRKAYQAKDAVRCGDSLACRMLMGEKVCGRYLANIRQAFCRFWTQERRKDAVSILAEEQEVYRRRGSDIIEGLKQRRAQLEVSFLQLETFLESFEPKSEPDYVSRINSYKILRRKFEQSLKKAREFSQDSSVGRGRRSSGEQGDGNQGKK